MARMRRFIYRMRNSVGGEGTRTLGITSKLHVGFLDLPLGSSGEWDVPGVMVVSLAMRWGCSVFLACAHSYRASSWSCGNRGFWQLEIWLITQLVCPLFVRLSDASELVFIATSFTEQSHIYVLLQERKDGMLCVSFFLWIDQDFVGLF